MIALMVGFSGMGGIQVTGTVGGVSRHVKIGFAILVGRKLSFSLTRGENRSGIHCHVKWLGLLGGGIGP
jgi:hypothetical protein